MHELLSHPGLKVYIFHIQGTLKYSHSRTGKPTKEYEICDTDYDDSDSPTKNNHENDFPPGKDASAVGLHIRVVKNDGTLDIQFVGKHGGQATWKFNGLNEATGRPIYATTLTQTELVDTTDAEIQTTKTKSTSRGTQTSFPLSVPSGTKKRKCGTRTDSVVETSASTRKRLSKETAMMLPVQDEPNHPDTMEGKEGVDSLTFSRPKKRKIVSASNKRAQEDDRKWKEHESKGDHIFKRKRERIDVVADSGKDAYRKRFLFSKCANEETYTERSGFLCIDTRSGEVSWIRGDDINPCLGWLREPESMVKVIEISTSYDTVRWLLRTDIKCSKWEGVSKSRRFKTIHIIHWSDDSIDFESDDKWDTEKVPVENSNIFLSELRKCIKSQDEMAEH
ncbi:hypothetical protein B0J11DRAFT_579358 [Dendryphion nanum]|uniref:Uncharacterized protein n=1 Tax=Dendryphion nanum TaxID=256645 RepID=A0A9P9DXB7_9PLEO|nr:hypothetical protein B0J11DRAFT_579358 [Dendryphion nanum]